MGKTAASGLKTKAAKLYLQANGLSKKMEQEADMAARQEMEQMHMWASGVKTNTDLSLETLKTGGSQALSSVQALVQGVLEAAEHKRGQIQRYVDQIKEEADQNKLASTRLKDTLSSSLNLAKQHLGVMGSQTEKNKAKMEELIGSSGNTILRIANDKSKLIARQAAQRIAQAATLNMEKLQKLMQDSDTFQQSHRQKVAEEVKGFEDSANSLGRTAKNAADKANLLGPEICHSNSKLERIFSIFSNVFQLFANNFLNN